MVSGPFPEAGQEQRAAPASPSDHEALVRPFLAARAEAEARFFLTEADRIARLCHAIAERFARGGRLVALGASPAARSDARHVAVEFVHPVIVGKRALPAFALSREGSTLAGQLRVLAEPGDIVLAFTDHGETGVEVGDTADAIAAARRRGCLTIALRPAGAAWELEVPTKDPFVRQEVAETLYHLLWELVHVFFEHRGLLAGRAAAPVHDSGASSFLYPFLG